jgi:hypothetical protein
LRAQRRRRNRQGQESKQGNGGAALDRNSHKNRAIGAGPQLKGLKLLRILRFRPGRVKRFTPRGRMKPGMTSIGKALLQYTN